jgi:hypothetical protein
MLTKKYITKLNILINLLQKFNKYIGKHNEKYNVVNLMIDNINNMKTDCLDLVDIYAELILFKMKYHTLISSEDIIIIQEWKEYIQNISQFRCEILIYIADDKQLITKLDSLNIAQVMIVQNGEEGIIDNQSAELMKASLKQKCKFYPISYLIDK